ncbi:MAG: phosphonate metabolism protein PhnP [Pseudomonadales bacterium]|nr:phosphonate metabolism protein PhnP [Pseudomonadales bacterium]
MRLTLLGTGAAAGFPVYGCECGLCRRAAILPELRRSPCSALIELGNSRYLIDAGQTNITECFPVGTLDGILLTHFHPDHVQGLFHLRWGKNCVIPVYTPPDTQGCADLYKHPGILQFQSCNKFVCFSLGELLVTPIPLIHSKPTFGYCFDINGQRLAYLTDTKGLPPTSLEFLKSSNLDLLLLDCTYSPDENLPGHNSIEDVLWIDHQLQPKTMVLTHIGHGMEEWLAEHQRSLPDHFLVARDGMSFLVQ